MRPEGANAGFFRSLYQVDSEVLVARAPMAPAIWAVDMLADSLKISLTLPIMVFCLLPIYWRFSYVNCSMSGSFI